jgi:proteasome accessory factor B
MAAHALRSASSDEGHVVALLEAMAGGRRVSFRYRGGETPADQTRRVDPFGVGYRSGAWYVAGHDADRRDIRVFRLGRIAGEVSTSRRGARSAGPPAGVDVADFFSAPPWSFGPVHGPSVEARIVVGADLAAAVARLLPDRVASRSLDGGSLLVRPLVRDAGLLFDWLLPMGPGCEIVGPIDLRAQMAVRLETTAVAWGRS